MKDKPKVDTMLERLGPPDLTASAQNHAQLNAELIASVLRAIDPKRQIEEALTYVSSGFSSEQEKIVLEWRAFNASPEGQARTKLMLRLKELTADTTIAQSETCIELLDALHHCLDHKFMAEGSGDVIAVLTPHFSRMGSPGAGGRAKAEAQARKDEDHRKLLRQHPGRKPKELTQLLMTNSKLNGGTAHAVVRRWLDSEEGKKSTAASTRKSSTTGKAQKPPAQT